MRIHEKMEFFCGIYPKEQKITEETSQACSAFHAVITKDVQTLGKMHSLTR